VTLWRWLVTPGNLVPTTHGPLERTNMSKYMIVKATASFGGLIALASLVGAGLKWY
jgi:hypothetical protein